MSDVEDLFDIFANDTETNQPKESEVSLPLAVGPPTAPQDGLGMPAATGEVQRSTPGVNEQLTADYGQRRLAAAAMGSGNGTGGLSVIRNASSNGAPVADVGRVRSHASFASGAASGDPMKVHVEHCSGIRVRRVTKGFEQLSVRLAEFPFLSFEVANGALRAQQRAGGGGNAASSVSALPKTCIGTLIRKTDPKQSAATRLTSGSSYAVCTLWSMRAASPSAATAAQEEVSFLLCGSAFDLLYGQLCLGAVIALSNLCALPAKRGGGSEASEQKSPLVKVTSVDDIRILGYAADMGTCAFVNRSTGEQCQAVVNQQRSTHCTFHVTANMRSGGAPASKVRLAGPNGKGPSSSGRDAFTTRVQLGSGNGGGLGTSSTPVARGPLARVNTELLMTSPAGATRVATTLATNRAQSQRLMNQQGFLTVSGGTGLPTLGSGPRSGAPDLAQTVYGTVQHAPLAKTRPTDLRIPSHYPTTQELGVSTRGRDVLEATRQLEAQREHDRLLRQALHRGERKAKTVQGGTTDRELAEGPPAFATRKRERDAEREEIEKALHQRQKTALPGANVGRTQCQGEESAPMKTTASVVSSSTRSLVDQIKQQFAPLRRGCVNDSFATSSPHGSAAPVGFGSGSRPASSSKTAHAGQSAVVAAVTEALRRSDTQLRQQKDRALAQRRGSTADATATAGSHVSLLSTIADHVQSSNDVLIREAEMDRVRSFLEGQIQRESALHALEQRHEQAVRATYCYGCREWYSRLPARCLEQHHRVEKKETVRRFYACELCGCKMTFLGEDTKPWKLMPRCPRCGKEIAWEKSNAAPEVAKPNPLLAPTPKE